MATPLEDLRDSLRILCDSIEGFNEGLRSGQDAGLLYQPPILELRESDQYSKSFLDGFSRFRSICEKELGIIQRMLDSPRPPHDLPSTNAPYLLSIWDEVLSARGPLWSINRLYVLPEHYGKIVGVEREGRSLGVSEVQVKVDLVCKGGQEWVKVNTIKLSRLISEFHQDEADLAYSDSSSDESTSSSSSLPPQKADPFYPVNSLTRQAYALAECARLNPLQSGKVPRVVLRLTRLTQREADEQARVGETFECIERMGVEIRLGPVAKEELARSEAGKSGRKIDWTNATNPQLRISHKVNLDLSLLIALISDITHASLPANAAEADERFVPTPKLWKRKTNNLTGEVSTIQLDEAEMGAEEHTRALGVQLKQEMEWKLIEELEDKLEEAVRVAGVGLDEVELWTTAEAKERCLEIVEKIGGDGERRRAAALLLDSGEDFWTGSRYVGRNGILSRPEIRLFPEVAKGPPEINVGPYTFRKALAVTCHKLLDPELTNFTNRQHIPLESLSLKPLQRIRVRDPQRGIHSGGGESGLSPVASKPKTRKTKSTPENARIPTIHTVRSMLKGAEHAMTTITANRTSVKQMVRAMGSMEGLEDEFALSAVAEFLVVEPKTLAEIKRNDWVDARREAEVPAQAEIWTVEPRSLAEAMRADYGSAEYGDRSAANGGQ